jgi:hypothetical protein
MKIRVFVPSELDPADGSTFSGTDHIFPILPSIGHVLRFTDERAGEFTVAKVGFMQDGLAFVAAVWLDGAKTNSPINSGPIDEGDDQDRYRDLNYDVPPETMEGY